MNCRFLIFSVLSLGTGLGVSVLAQGTGLEAAESGPSDLFKSGGWPAWLKLGVELRGRSESGNAFDPPADDRFYLNRLRLNVIFRPRPWVRFFLQGQDA